MPPGRGGCRKRAGKSAPAWLSQSCPGLGPELRFDRMVIEPDTAVPIDARVVGVSGYRVDNQGRNLGKGHATRDIVTWSIRVLWPITC